MKSSQRFTPVVETLDDRIALATMPITLSPLTAPVQAPITLSPPTTPVHSSNLVLTLPGTKSQPVGPADDAYENNDTRDQARDIATLTGTLNSTATKVITNLMMMDNADWFKFTMTQRGAAGSGVSIRFSSAQGQLTLCLFDSAGNLLRASFTPGDLEAVTLAGRAPGTYYVLVRGLNGVHNPNYTLAVKQATLTGGPTFPVVPPSPPGVPQVPTIPPPPASGFNIALRFGPGITAAEQFAFQQAANRWGQLIVGDLPDAVYQGVAVDDLLIDVSVKPLDGINGTLAQSRPDTFRTTGVGTIGGLGLPIHGTMTFDSADIGAFQFSGQLYSLILHEMAHVLGFGTMWQSRLLLIGSGSSDPRYIGSQALAQYNAIFNTTASGIPLEATGGAGTAESHWRESVFGAELMTGFFNPGVPNPLSRVTVAVMGDLGYTINLNAADPYVP